MKYLYIVVVTEAAYFELTMSKSIYTKFLCFYYDSKLIR